MRPITSHRRWWCRLDSVFYSLVELGTICHCAGAVTPLLGSPSSAIWLVLSISASTLRACENGGQIITSAFIFSFDFQGKKWGVQRDNSISVYGSICSCSTNVCMNELRLRVVFLYILPPRITVLKKVLLFDNFSYCFRRAFRAVEFHAIGVCTYFLWYFKAVL